MVRARTTGPLARERNMRGPKKGEWLKGEKRKRNAAEKTGERNGEKDSSKGPSGGLCIEL